MKDKLILIGYYALAMIWNAIVLMVPFLILMFIIEMMK